MIPRRLAFIDLETTGADPTRDRVTEIGVIEVDGDEVNRWSTLVNPERKIPAFIEQLTGIRNDMVADAPTFAAVAAELARRLEGRVFVAHNARFDYGFIKNEFQRLGQRFRADVLCTVRLSRALFPQHPRHNLDSLIERHGLRPLDRHRALADADLLWQWWRVVHKTPGEAALAAAVANLLKRPSLPPYLDPTLPDELPEAPGVYRFFGESDALLYVGKSVNLRQRVLAHFSADTRVYREMRLAQEVRRIDWQETVGELGALLLESRLIKEAQPIYNRRQRRVSNPCAWQLHEVAPGDFRPHLVNGDDTDFGRGSEIYGVYPTPRAAQTALRKIAEAYQLCPALLGLESPAAPGRPCFALQVKRCKGACVGHEPIGMHSARLLAALARLKLATWPFPGPIGLVERDEFRAIEAIHVVDAWCHLGTARSIADVHALLEAPRQVRFDIDTYKLLKKQLAKGNLAIRRLDGAAAIA